MMASLVALVFTPAPATLVNSWFAPVSVKPDPPGPNSVAPGAGTFLVAKRSLADPNFGRSVVYLIEHDDQGTFGLIVNRSIDSSLLEVVPELGDPQAAAHAMHYGGPVGLSLILMLVRSASVTEGIEHVAGDVYIGSDRSAIEAVLAAKKPADQARFYVGHAGWAAGQLEFELARGSWHVVPADADEIFSGETGSLWQRLIERLEPAGIQVQIRNSRRSMGQARHGTAVPIGCVDKPSAVAAGARHKKRTAGIRRFFELPGRKALSIVAGHAGPIESMSLSALPQVPVAPGLKTPFSNISVDTRSPPLGCYR